jgi:hypothetical protein
MKNIFLIGGQRCATTYLAGILDQHPEIEFSKPYLPEPKHLLKNEFIHSSDYKYHGDKTASYLYNQEVSKKIKDNFIDPKVIVVLRNPTDRAISHYRLSVFHGLEKRSIDNAMFETMDYNKEIYPMSPFDYLEYSDYQKYLKNYQELDLLILFYEDIIKHNIQPVLEFLKLDKFQFHSNLNKHEIEIEKDISKKLKNKLKDYFKPKIKKLESHLNIDLSFWNHF